MKLLPCIRSSTAWICPLVGCPLVETVHDTLSYAGLLQVKCNIKYEAIGEGAPAAPISVSCELLLPCSAFLISKDISPDEFHSVTRPPSSHAPSRSELFTRVYFRKSLVRCHVVLIVCNDSLSNVCIR
jgi:hypothetical protein